MVEGAGASGASFAEEPCGAFKTPIAGRRGSSHAHATHGRYCVTHPMHQPSTPQTLCAVSNPTILHTNMIACSSRFVTIDMSLSYANRLFYLLPFIVHLFYMVVSRHAVISLYVIA
jgi:hypothetical protein